MNKLTEIKKQRKKTAEIFGGICSVCSKKFGKNFHFHHIEYRDDEKKHSDFASWINYNEYVLPIITSIPKKFALLCNGCHRLVSILQAIKDDSRFERLVNLTRRSRK